MVKKASKLDREKDFEFQKWRLHYKQSDVEMTAPAGVWVPAAVRPQALSSSERSEDRRHAHEA
jgi:hypothetical protein